MADISKVLFLRHLRANPTAYIRHVRRGRPAHEGAGLAFWFRPLTAALSEVPIDDREQPLLFHARTVDFQDVTVQASVTYRLADPALAATRIDFGVDVDRGTWRAAPLEQVGSLLTELAQQHALDLLAGMTLTQALAEGMVAARERIATGLAGDTRLSDVGLALVDVRVVAVRAEPDVERALQTPTREQVQQDADRATYERRALAVERERAIAENELQNKIELARREAQLVEQQGRNERSRATEQAAAARIEAEGSAERQRVLAGAQAEATRLVGTAEADAEAARLAAYRDVDDATLIGLAARELAGNLPSIGTLTLTPDLLTPILARLGAGASGDGASPTGGPDGGPPGGRPSGGRPGRGRPGGGARPDEDRPA
jgi:regulator of protease activity HflC (stomatin/prohibitin superfamily)